MQRAAMYTVRVRPHRHPDEWRLLGDFDEAGTWIGDEILPTLRRLDDLSRDGKVSARFEAVLPKLTSTEVGVSMFSGRAGVSSVLRRAGRQPYDRTPEHSEDMRTAVLFQLNHGLREGRLAVHVPEGRSVKGIVERWLTRRFSELGYVLEMNPMVPLDAFREAVFQGNVDRVTLIKKAPGESEQFADAAQWGTDVVDHLELTIPAKRNHRLRRDPLTAFLEEPTDTNRKRILEFEGLTFDKAGVTVELADGVTRTFYLEEHSGGHPMSTGLNINENDRYGATPRVLVRELRSALRD